MKAVQMDNSMPVQPGIARVLTLLGHCWGLCSICYSEGKVPMAFKQEEYRFKEYGSETEAMKDKLKLFSLHSDFSPDNP